jgi:hypothetical protein
MECRLSCSSPLWSDQKKCFTSSFHSLKRSARTAHTLADYVAAGGSQRIPQFTADQKMEYYSRFPLAARFCHGEVFDFILARLTYDQRIPELVFVFCDLIYFPIFLILLSVVAGSLFFLRDIYECFFYKADLSLFVISEGKCV